MKVQMNNVRNIDMKEFFEIKNLNIIVGKNSAGKSTFLRFFPLLKQSIEKNITNALLWYGPYVDFGSFEETVSQKKTSAENITFSFQLDFPYTLFLMNFSRSFYNLPHLSSSDYIRKYVNKEASTSISISFKIVKDAIVEYNIKTNGFDINLKVNSNQNLEIFIDDKQVLENQNLIFRKRANSESLIPESIVVVTNKEKDKKIPDKININGNESLLSFSHNQLIDYLDTFIPKNIGYEKKMNITSIFLSTIIEMLNIPNLDFKNSDILNQYSTTIPKRVWTMINQEQPKKLDYEFLYQNIILYSLESIISVLNVYLTTTLTSLDYIAPLRASAERYYRQQSLSVESIDSKGENLSAYIRSLTKPELKELNLWLSASFDFELGSNPIKGHSSIMIREKNSLNEINIMDCGFGYSQILPILLQLWIIAHKSPQRKNQPIWSYSIKDLNNKILVIEQPELHLHPALQAKLIDVLCQLIKEFEAKKKKLSIIIETHSETIVNRVYKNMLMDDIDKSDVNITIFEKDETGTAKITNAIFDNNTRITNWPKGFFQPEV